MSVQGYRFALHRESLPAVENVHEGNGEDIGLLGSGKVGNVGVQRNTLLQVSTWENRPRGICN